MDPLPEAKKELLSRFKEVTLEGDDRRSVEYLEYFAWNLEDATLSYISGYRIPRPRLNEPLLDSNLASLPFPNSSSGSSTQSSSPPGPGEEGQSGSIWADVWRFLVAIFQSIFSVVYFALMYFPNMLTGDAPIGATMHNLEERLRETFKDLPAPNLGGSVQEALNIANSTSKLLLCVTFKDFGTPSMQILKELLCHPTVAPILSSHYMIWPANYHKRSNVKVFENAVPRVLPCFEVVRQRGSSIVIRSMTYSREDNVKKLYDFLNAAKSLSPTIPVTTPLPPRSTKTNKSDQRRLLIEQQDQEYQSMLHKEAELEREKQRLLDQKTKEMEENISRQKKREKRVDLFSALRQKVKAQNTAIHLTTEGAKSETRLNLRLKHPDGFTSTASLSLHQPMQDLFEHVVATKSDLSRNFYLYTNLPRNHICHFDVEKEPDCRTLLEYSIDTSQVIMVEYSDEE